MRKTLIFMVATLAFLSLMVVICSVGLLGYHQAALKNKDIKNDFLDDLYFRLSNLSTTVMQGKAVPVKLYMAYGGVMVGDLISETELEYIIKYQESMYTIEKSQVKGITRGEESFGWAYNNDVVAILTNGKIIDSKIIDVKNGYAVFEHSADATMELPISSIEYVKFRPVDNDLSRKVENRLKGKFEAMKIYKEGNITLFTNSYITWVKEFQKHIRCVQTEIYFKFFDLFEGKKPIVQNFAVVFDNFEDYLNQSERDGVPGLYCPGYYDPEQRVFYLFNMLGEDISGRIEKMVGNITKSVDNQADQYKRGRHSSDQTQIDGIAHQIKDRFWRYFNLVLSNLRNITITVLRHELTHGIFFNNGIQGVQLSKEEIKKSEAAEKKQKILQGSDKQSAKEWITSILSSAGDENLQMKGANSWAAEGIATYCETYPIGSRNDERLYGVQEMIRTNKLFPLATLTYYKMGSFSKVYSNKMVLNAYSQSWALVSFLMDNYRTGFIKYLKGSAEDFVRTDKEDLEFLLQCLGVDDKTVDREFGIYLAIKYPEQLPDPFIEIFDYIRKLFTEDIY